MTDIWNLPSNISSIYIGQKEIQSIVQTKDSTVLYQKSASHTYLLTAQLSPSTIYTDGSTVISGVLTDNGSAMANETITIYDGNTSLGTCTTDSNGAYSKTLTGFNSGNHSLKASHTNADSSTVNLTVNNHSYAISVSANPSTITSEQSSIISATLTKDGSAYGSQTVTFSYGGNSYTSTTDANGVATYTYTGTGAGSVTITASSNGASNTVTITDNPSGGSTPSQLSVTATKDVLSKHHNDTSTLTATVLDANNNPCSGETVTFKKGSTVLSTDTTDANGKAEYIYVATGVGDVTITVECSLLSEIYELEDRYMVIEEMTPTPNSPFNLGLFNSNLIIELDYYPVNMWEWAWVRLDNVNHGVWSSSYDKGNNIGFTNLGYNKWIHISWKYENGTITMTANNNTITSHTDTALPFDIDFYSNRNGTKYKNFKVTIL